MKINVTFLPAEVSGLDLANTICIVLDILRATTSITTAMANGCEVIHPVLTVEEARKLAKQIPGCLLAGERRSLRIEGFDLGNSPYDFQADKVQGRKIIMTTTNGTVAIRATEGACKTFIGCFLNAAALSSHVKRYNKDILIVCAGTERLFSLEDALCAGYLVELLRKDNSEITLTDAAYAALLMYSQAQGNLLLVARYSRNGKRLYEIGREQDVEYCFRQNVLNVVPEYASGSIRL